ncbi:UNVERIFIED_CONTAM: hypothetical protein Slati_0893000 [Sesamum latifolium]|uniref:Reverse transcriptase zinc-binding domain-containing protein n=1 Tax=Sesamum latifolium TaxID=2727402 RepID=A0AAW2XNS7_9LAMI
MLSFAGRVQLIKSVLSALQVYWAMAFILPKHVIKEVEKRLRNFLWKGSTAVGYAKVSWKQPPITNRESMEITHSLPTIHGGCDRILWTGPGSSFSSSAAYAVFAPPGPKDALPETHDHLFFICSFATECLHAIRRETLGIPLEATLNVVIANGDWNWPEILDIHHREIMDKLPPLSGTDCISWNSTSGRFTNQDSIQLFQPMGPKVAWHIFLTGSFRIPRNNVILWLAIFGRLSTLDQAWWQ